MRIRRFTTMISALAVGSTALVGAAMPANAAQARAGDTSLAEVLAADKGFDKTARDFDILEAAVGAVLADDPGSPVSLLTDGSVRLTAFAPTDGAFRRLVEDLTGKRYKSEKRVFKTLAGAVGIEAVQDVLLYHVVPGMTITAKKAVASDGAKLETALGKKITVKVRHGSVVLRDADRNDKNARVIGKLADINKGNKQIAHGITQVLRPMDL